jgi:hypothetical protein
MVRTRPTLPAGHGEVVEQPPFSEWAGLVQSNRARAAASGFTFAGMGSAEASGRATRCAVAAAFYASSGSNAHAIAREPLVSRVTNRLYHPGGEGFRDRLA